MSGPTMFYPPPPTTSYFAHSRAHCTSYSPSPEPQLQQAPRPPPPAAAASSSRCRKRSRDQLEDDERAAAFDESNTMEVSMPAPEPIYGEGMVLIDAITGRPVGSDGSSGAGTWYEEQIEEERRANEAAAAQLARDQADMARALTRPSKASKLDLTGVNNATRTGSPSTAPGMIAPAPLTPETPSAAAAAYDEAAMTLGVGWRSVSSSDDPALAGASKGWARYIDNHFAGLCGSEVLARSEGKEAFLVRARDLAAGADGFYLFSDQLTEGRLLSAAQDRIVSNLQAGIFEGPPFAARLSVEPMTPPQEEVTMEM